MHSQKKEDIEAACVFVNAGEDHHLLISQGCLSDFYTVRLGRKPTHNVVISVDHVPGLEVYPAMVLIENDDNWNKPRKIRVTASSETGSEQIVHEFQIRHNAGSEDPLFNGSQIFAPSYIRASALDDDAPFMFVVGSNHFGQLGIDWNKASQVNVPKLLGRSEIANAKANRKSTQRKEIVRVVPPAKVERRKPQGNDTSAKDDTVKKLKAILETKTPSMTPSEMMKHRLAECSNNHRVTEEKSPVKVQELIDERMRKEEEIAKSVVEEQRIMDEMTKNCSSQTYSRFFVPETTDRRHQRPKTFMTFRNRRRAESAEKPQYTTTDKLGQYNVISAGHDHSAFVTDKGKVYLFGSNDKGQLGREEKGKFSIPTKWDGIDIQRMAHNRVVSVSCGSAHTCLVTSEGYVLTMGCGLNGRLGHGDVKECRLPRVVEKLKTSNAFIKKACCGGRHTMALSDTSRVYSWGYGRTGALGLGHLATHEAQRVDMKVPTTVSLLEEVRPYEIAAGGLHSAALCQNGQLLTWGWGLDGQLGRPCEGGESVPAPALLPKGLNARHVSCGGHHTLMLLDDNNVYACGANQDGQLGLGHAKLVKRPSCIEMLEGKDVYYLAAGRRFSIAVCEDGVVYSWGGGPQGQLGMGMKDQVVLPQICEALLGLHIVQVTAGDSHTLFTSLDDGDVEITDSKSLALKQKLKMQKFGRRLREERVQRRRYLSSKGLKTGLRRRSMVTAQELAAANIRRSLDTVGGTALGDGKKMKMKTRTSAVPAWMRDRKKGMGGEPRGKTSGKTRHSSNLRSRAGNVKASLYTLKKGAVRVPFTKRRSRRSKGRSKKKAKAVKPVGHSPVKCRDVQRHTQRRQLDFEMNDPPTLAPTIFRSSRSRNTYLGCVIKLQENSAKSFINKIKEDGFMSTATAAVADDRAKAVLPKRPQTARERKNGRRPASMARKILEQEPAHTNGKKRRPKSAPMKRPSGRKGSRGAVPS
jgi:alpha-tubulin suppressor-like RCC1 family protein